LGIEIPYEELPIVQRRIVKTSLRVGKPVIVATHMLESMIESPMPTRAEVTDVANAVFEQADAIMLSGETTVGKYPLKCIEVFDRIAERTNAAAARITSAGRTCVPTTKPSARSFGNEPKAAAIR
jgi:pyruvate kinase